VNNDTYLGYGYNVEVDDAGNITITNTMQNCAPHVVKLVAKNGAYFGADASATQVEFAQVEDGASQTFQVNKDAVAVGSAYLEVYYNQEPGTAGVVPDKVFIKK
ncbi:major fimbrial subunit protein (FimA), partial [Porphyromonas gulae]